VVQVKKNTQFLYRSLEKQVLGICCYLFFKKRYLFFSVVAYLSKKINNQSLMYTFRLWSPLNLPFNGYWGPSPWVKQPGGNADHSLPSSAEVKNVWSYTSIPQYIFMAQCLIKQWHLT
jgi:hypothetical protein